MDLDKNLKFNQGDILMDNLLVTSTPFFSNSITKKGNYLLNLDKDITYKIEVSNINSKYFTIIPNFYNINVGQTKGLFGTYDFILQENGYIDLEVKISGGIARPGQETSSTIAIHNIANSTTNKANLSYNFPFSWTIVQSTPKFSRQVANTLYWDNITVPAPGGFDFYKVVFTVPSTLPIGTKYEYSADLLCNGDQYLKNNSSIWKSDIRGSYDPNDKLVEDERIENKLINEKELIYTIRFQNTGNDTAFKVVIKDTLSNAFDPKSVRLVNYSHPCFLVMEKLGYVEFHFDPIKLPDSTTNQIRSHGFVQFALKTKGSFEPENLIKNQASIYFDNNLPIQTNIATTKVVTVGTVDDKTKSYIQINPNPFQENFMIEYDLEKYIKNYELNIVDLNGKKLYTQLLDKSNGMININSKQFPKSVFQVIIYGDGKILANTKLVKM